MTPTSQPSGLGELATLVTPETSPEAHRGPGTVQRAQVSPWVEAGKSKEPQDKPTKKLSPIPASRAKRYTFELWVEIEVSPGVYGTPEVDSYGIDFIDFIFYIGGQRVWDYIGGCNFSHN